MDTDYDNYAMICTCQSKKILFDALTFHRRSCTILQRSPERDTTITNEVRFYSQEFYFLINVRWICQIVIVHVGYLIFLLKL